ncbi:MAG: 6-hydroxymethylpterin diphosphokinase MptE-like protein [Promethearchaeota archaeon]
MDWENWEPWYNKIISDFGYDPQKDLESSLILNDFLKKRVNKKDFKDLIEIIKDNIVFIYGCGPSLPHHLQLLKNSPLQLEKFIHIAANGATSALLEYNIIPNIVVTDLDGQITDLMEANKMGAILIIHAHGDNIDTINQYISQFHGSLMGTTQNQTLNNVKNYGGFTDGDRCVYIAEELGASIIILFGFDFGNIIGKFSKFYLKQDEIANEIKLKKLQWAQILIKELSINSKILIIKVNGKKIKLGNVKNYEFRDLIKKLKP